MYLAYKHAGLSQKDVGCTFGIRSFAVSKAAVHIERTLKSNRKLRRLILRLTAALLDVPR